MISATNNYWGHSTGPSGAGTGYGDGVSANVVYSSWLISSPIGMNCPSITSPPTPTPTPIGCSGGAGFGTQNDGDICPASTPTPTFATTTPIAKIDLSNIQVEFDQERFDYLQGYLDLRTQLGISIEVKQLDNLRLPLLNICKNASLPTKEKNFCYIHTAILLFEKAVALSSMEHLTHRVMIESLVWGEYGSYIIGFPLYQTSPLEVEYREWVWTDEAIARQFYTACSIDGCQNDEIYDFLEYFQSPLNGSLYEDYESLNQIRNRSEPYWQNLVKPIPSSSKAILSPPPDNSSWTVGIVADSGQSAYGQPYGYGTDIRVSENSLASRKACNDDAFAYIVERHFDGRVNIFFGTTFLNGGDSCRFIQNG